MGDQDFEQWFRNEFSDFEANPSESNWEHIQAGLKKPTSRLYDWTRVTVAVLLCFLFLPLGKPSYEEVGYGTFSQNSIPLSDKEASVTVPPIVNNFSTHTKRLSEAKPSFPETPPPAKVATQNDFSQAVQHTSINRLSSRGITSTKAILPFPKVTFPSSASSSSAPVIKKTPDKASRKIRMYAEAMPFLTYHHFSPSTQDAILINSSNAASSFNQERIGYQLSLGTDLSITPKFQFTVGFFYRMQPQTANFQTSEVEENQFEQTENGYNIIPTFITTTHQYQVSYQSVGGHIMGLYQLWSSRKRKTQHVGVGFQGGHLMNYREIVDDTDSFLSASQQTYSVNLAYRITYQISPQLSLSLQPTLNYFLINKKQTAPVSARPYTFGISIGIRYSN